MVYGFQWTGSNPLLDIEAAKASIQFAGALMAILLAHEMAHYWVAKAHGFSLSLPYFIPFPAAFGTYVRGGHSVAKSPAVPHGVT